MLFFKHVNEKHMIQNQNNLFQIINENTEETGSLGKT